MQKPPKHDGSVLELFISKTGESQRVKREHISLDTLGVIDDKFYNKELNRSVLLSFIDTYTMAQKSNIELEHGLLGENILLNYNPYTIPVDKEFHIGEVTLVITQNCTLCRSLTKIDKRLPKLLKNDRGIFARVLEGGVIKIGDRIEVN